MELDRATFLKGAGASMVALRTAPRQPNAYVFSRPGGAQTAAGIFGHVGWAYRDGGDAWVTGAIEMAHHNSTPKGKDLWWARTAQPLLRMAAHDNVGVGWETRYDLYKPLYGAADRAAARRAVGRLVPWRFAAPGHDCLDAVRLVLEAYGVPFNGLEKRTVNPNAFFGLLAGKAVPLNIPWPGSVIDASLYDEYDRQGLRDDIITFDRQAVIFDDDISYDPTSKHPQIAWSSFVLRRGHMAIYNKPGFSGGSVLLRPEATVDLKTLPWPYREIGSYVISTKPFDPDRPPVAGIKPRFANRTVRSQYYEQIRQKPY